MDSSLQALTRTINKLGEAFEAFKETNDERIAALEGGDQPKAAELDHKVKKIEVDLGKLGKLKSDIEVEMRTQKERIEELESRRDQPGSTVLGKIQSEYKDTFNGWLRQRAPDPATEYKLTELERKAAVEARNVPESERKDVTIGTGSAGGFAVPEEISREIELMERKYSPVRELVKVVRAGTSDYKELVNIRGTTGGWVGETGTRTATATSALRERTPTHGELYAYPQVSEWSLDDIFFTVETWLADEVADTFAIEEGLAVISGNGTSRPTGMLNTAPTAIPDAFPPVRNENSYEFIESVASPQNEIGADTLIDLVYALNSRYRVGATWVMNSVTTGTVRKLKDSQLQYLWQPGLQAGEPDRLLGYPHRTWEQLSNPVNGAFPIGFGNFRRGYVLVDRVGMRITRDQVTNPGFVRFYVRRREGGHVLNNDAIKWIRV